jgi:hypothetical protein
LTAVGSGDWTLRDGVWVVGLHDRHQLTKALGERHFMVVDSRPWAPIASSDSRCI